MLATGIGWLVLLDLSANGDAGNRYLALYHQGHLWLAMLVLSLVCVPAPADRTRARLDAFDGGRHRSGSARASAASRQRRRARRDRVGARVAFGVAARQHAPAHVGARPVWLIVGAAWFFFLRGDAAGRASRAQRKLARLARCATCGRSLFVVGVLVGAMVITRDMGPLLIAGYGAGAFLAASVAMWWHAAQRQRGRARSRSPLLLFVGVDRRRHRRAVRARRASTSVTAARLENLAAPLASANDQLALVTWFQRAAPAAGFGLGAVPWCGFGARARRARRAGADPERLHVHRAGRRVRLDGGVGA